MPTQKEGSSRDSCGTIRSCVFIGASVALFSGLALFDYRLGLVVCGGQFAALAVFGEYYAARK